MIKDAAYYVDRIRQKSLEIYRQEIASLPDEEALERIDYFNDEQSMEAVLSRISFNFPEAREIIKQINSSSAQFGNENTYDLMWVSEGSEKMPYGGELMTAKMTGEQMIARLHWISSEEFGEDFDEWATWLAAFEENPPPRGFR